MRSCIEQPIAGLWRKAGLLVASSVFMSLGEKEMGDLSPVRAGRHLTLRGLLQEQLEPRFYPETTHALPGN